MFHSVSTLLHFMNSNKVYTREKEKKKGGGQRVALFNPKNNGQNSKRQKHHFTTKLTISLTGSMTQRSSCSSSSPINKFDVFDFSEESKIEKLTKKMLRKLRTPTKSPSPPISKYEFLQACKSPFLFLFPQFRFLFRSFNFDSMQLRLGMVQNLNRGLFPLI